MQTVSLFDAKTQLSRLIDQIATVAETEIVISRNGKPVARAVESCAAAGYRELPPSWQHAAVGEILPPLHADPFDRILVAQAMAEPMCLLSGDAKVVACGAMVLAV